MTIRNTSQYDTAEVKRLVRFAADGLAALDIRRICVNVRNYGRSGAIAGRAYPLAPRCSNAPPSAIHLVVLRIGSPDKFPADNVYEHYRWIRVKDGETYDPAKVRSIVKVRNGVQERYLERLEEFRQTYGGKQSPYMIYETWQEGMVAIAAHELTHIFQYQARLAMKESTCEYQAARAIDRYRESIVPRGTKQPQELT